MNVPDISSTYYVIAGVAAVVLLVSLWQRAIDRHRSAEAHTAIRDAHERGTHKPIAQFPNIEPLLCIGCGSCVKACPEEGVLELVDGMSRVVNGSKCIGHAKCEAVCPVGAIKVTLGDVSDRADVPVLTENLETNVPGLFIAGELGGIALIRNAIDQGVRAMSEVARRAKGGHSRRGGDPVDVVVVGAGPAGIAAGLKAVEEGLTYQIIDQDDLGGTVRKYPRRKLTLIQATTMPMHGKISAGEYYKEDVLKLWEKIIAKAGLQITARTKFEGLEKKVQGFQVNTSNGPIQARFVILAMGRRGTPRKLDVPGEEHEKVLYQLIDAATYTHKHILVVGGGDSAVEAALALAEQPGNVVTISYRRDGFTRLKKKNEDRIRGALASGKVKVMFSSEVMFIETKTVCLHLAKAHGPKAVPVPNDYVFIFAGGDPPFPMLKQAGIGFGGKKEGRPAHRSAHRPTAA